MPAQSNGALQFRYFSLSAYEDDGRWMKDKIVINKNTVMVGKGLGYCILKERERVIASDEIRTKKGKVKNIWLQILFGTTLALTVNSLFVDQVQYNDSA
jgi:hypothetical protein